MSDERQLCGESYYPTPGHPDGAPFCRLQAGHPPPHITLGNHNEFRVWVDDKGAPPRPWTEHGTLQYALARAGLLESP